ncbi:MAG TPA: leucine-rich repeat protein [Acholeplasma sp.]|nr:leucine-rich repeat protein [Acholeplasma sp.]
MGDGFTIDEQQLFLDYVSQIANYMITVEPFNYYKDYLTVYALHSISKQSGISGEVDGYFACMDIFGNPATPQCTPIDSSEFNCIHGRDTFYNSYYQYRSSADRVILEMSFLDRERARNDALASVPCVDIVQVIANSGMRGGTGEMPNSNQPLGVALTSINTANPYGDWKEVVIHELGHSFGGLWDEYWNGITPDEYPNVTQVSNPSTVKWSQWVGYKNVGVYPFSADEYDGNPNQANEPWYRPHQECMMRQTCNPFCPVCVQELLDRMAIATGLTMFNTTNIGTDSIRIDKFNLNYNGNFVVPERINGKVVVEIGSLAFANKPQLTVISILNTITSIGNSAFANCANLEDVDILGSINSITFGSRPFRGCILLYNKTIYTDYNKHGIVNTLGNVNISNHSFTYSPNGVFPFPTHTCECNCGYSRIGYCIGNPPIGPYDDVYCGFCGQKMNNHHSPFNMITLPDGNKYVVPQLKEFEYQELLRQLGYEQEAKPIKLESYNQIVNNKSDCYRNDLLCIVPKEYKVEDYLNEN